MELKRDRLLQGGRYRIIESIGRGGFGITYLAEQVMAKRKVCIKEFFPKDYYKRDGDTGALTISSDGFAESMNKFKAKFVKEAQTIAALDHHNIIPIYDVFEENNTAYYVMEYIDGVSLSSIVKESGALSEDVAVGYIKQIASALAHIHEQQIMHLDVKPGNIMVRSKDNRSILIDFGLSKHYDENSGEATSTTPVGVSHGYAPIEQYKQGGVNRFSPETDIYSLGATLYYIATGIVPPHAADMGKDGIGELPSELSSGVCAAIRKSMNYWKEDRPHTIKEFLELLDSKTATPIVPIVSNEKTTLDSDNNIASEQKSTPKPAEQKQEAEQKKPTEQKQTPKATEPKAAPAEKKVAEPKAAPAEKKAAEPKKEWTPKYGVNKPKTSENETSKKRKSLWWLWLIVALVTVVAILLFIPNAEKDNASTQQSNTKTTATTTQQDSIPKATMGTLGNTEGNDEEYSSTAEQPSNEIWYTSTDNKEVAYKKDVFGATVVDQRYDDKDNKWVIVFDKDVTMIGEHAFADCRRLTSVSIPNSVTSIRSSAFIGCYYIKEFKGKFSTKDGRCIIKDNSLIAYANTSGTTYNIPDSVTSIGDYAFYGCSSLTSITIPNCVTEIGGHAFYCCNNLSNITVGNSVTKIGEGAFRGCSSLTSITIPNGVTEIGYRAFSDCSNLTSITIPNGVTEIKNETFWGSSRLKSVNIPDSVTEIEDSAFYNCNSLTNITIPNSVTEIGGWAFRGCDSLTSITIPDSVTKIGYSAFCLCNSLESITISNSVTEIEKQTFSSCSSLTSITIPDSVTKIGEDAFRGCSSLESITISEGVKSIEAYAFKDCDSLESIILPNSITSIAENALSDCDNLKHVFIKASVVPTLVIFGSYTDGKFVIDQKQKVGYTIYVPRNSVDAYKYGWNRYADQIVGYDF